MKPARGLLLVKRVQTEDVIRGIIAPPQTLDKWTAQQFEVVAVGEPMLYEEDAVPAAWWTREALYDVDGVGVLVYPAAKLLPHRGKALFYRDVDPAIVPGAWIIVTPRVLMPTGDHVHFLIRQDHVMAVIEG